MENTMNSDSTHSAPRSKTPYEHLWLPFTYFKDVEENPPLIIDKGEGIYLFDSSGCAYIDGIGSWWVSIFGHNHPVITSARDPTLVPQAEKAKAFRHMLAKGIRQISHVTSG